MTEAMDSISCPICIDPLKNPVTIPCGHSYCMECIVYYWDQDDQKGVCSCPICQESFIPRPVLKKNTVLVDLVDKIEKMGFESASTSNCYAGSEDLDCDVCTERKQKALKSCLVCLASYCEAHLQPHHKSPAFKNHKLVKASSNLQEKICSRHNKLLEVFCRTDQKCICYLCFVGQHKDHETVSAVREIKEKQMELGLSQQKLQQTIQERNKEQKELQQAVMSFNHSAQEAEKNSERIFNELIRSIERRRSEVKKLIRAQQRAAVSQAEGLLERLEREIAELKTRDAELEKLSLTEDHILFLLRYQSLSSLSSDLPVILVPPPLYFGDVTEALSELKEKLENLLKGEWLNIPTKLSLVDVVLPLEPKTRDDFLKYSCSLTLDPNTAQKHIRLSNGNRKAKCVWPQPYPNHSERFYKCLQVLCKEDVSARCYWEVEWSVLGVYIALSYKDVGCNADCGFGCNDKSWSLQCYNGGYSFKYNNVATALSGPMSSRVGVYLDHKAGTLSFYSISDTMTLLHQVQTTFTQPLYPGFGFGFVSLVRGSSFELC